MTTLTSWTWTKMFLWRSTTSTMWSKQIIRHLQPLTRNLHSYKDLKEIVIWISDLVAKLQRQNEKLRAELRELNTQLKNYLDKKKSPAPLKKVTAPDSEKGRVQWIHSCIYDFLIRKKRWKKNSKTLKSSCNFMLAITNPCKQDSNLHKTRTGDLSSLSVALSA